MSRDCRCHPHAMVLVTAMAAAGGRGGGKSGSVDRQGWWRYCTLHPDRGGAHVAETVNLHGCASPPAQGRPPIGTRAGGRDSRRAERAPGRPVTRRRRRLVYPWTVQWVDLRSHRRRCNRGRGRDLGHGALPAPSGLPADTAGGEARNWWPAAPHAPRRRRGRKDGAGTGGCPRRRSLRTSRQ